MNSADETSRRLQRAFAATGWDAAPGDECPSAERVWMAVRGELPHLETSHIILHTATCAACAAAWRLAHSTGADAPREPHAAAPAWRSVWVWGPGLAAAALLVTGLLGDLPLRLRESPAPVSYREGAEAAIQSLLPDGAELPRDALVLRWSPGPPGSRYNVRVMTEDLSWIAGAWSIDSTQYQVPAEAVAALAAGAKLLWQVDVDAPDQPRRTSSTFILRVQ